MEAVLVCPRCHQPAVSDCGDGTGLFSSACVEERCTPCSPCSCEEEATPSCEDCRRPLTGRDFYVYRELGGAPADAVPRCCEACAEKEEAE